MARYGIKTSMTPDQVLDLAQAFFGPGGEGMTEQERGACCARFQGSGGHVMVTTAEENEKTAVDIETREWDYQVKRFMGRLKR